MKKLFLLIGATLCLWLINSAQAAGPVTHVLLADKWLKSCKKYTPAEHKAFIVGTLYPDIRYMVGLDRDVTHSDKITLDAVRDQADPFTAGSMFHSWVDNAREYYLQGKKGKILSKLKGVCSLLGSNYLKFLEDEIYFNQGSWTDVRGDLKTVSEDEKKGGIDEADLQKWNNVLIQQLTYSPSMYFERLVYENKRFFELPPDVVLSWSHSLLKNARDPFFKQYSHDLMAFFDEELASCQGTKTYPFIKVPDSMMSIKYWTKLFPRLSQQYVWPHLSESSKDSILEEECALLS